MENKQQAKKEWTKPELTVLVRNNAEEAVLTACKGGLGTGSFTDNTNCTWRGCLDSCALLAGS
jgi:hypothetical protein